MKYLIYVSLVLFSFAASASAGFKETFEREFLTEPWAGGRIEEKSACIECHTSETMKQAYRLIPEEWMASWHYQNDVSCHDCHGGDPRDASMSMSHKRGFAGSPKPAALPEFCGKCHIGILKNYLESDHGKALKTGKGPHCVTCHGSHNIQKVNIDIINEQLCTKCHSYERAKVMKQALFLTEKKIGEIEKQLAVLKTHGVYTAEEDKALFSTHAEFRALFHSVDVDLVKSRTDEFSRKLETIEKKVQGTFDQLKSRRNYSAFLLFLFIIMGVALFRLSSRQKE